MVAVLSSSGSCSDTAFEPTGTPVEMYWRMIVASTSRCRVPSSISPLLILGTLDVQGGHRSAISSSDLSTLSQQRSRGQIQPAPNFAAQNHPQTPSEGRLRRAVSSRNPRPTCLRPLGPSDIVTCSTDCRDWTFIIQHS